MLSKIAIMLLLTGGVLEPATRVVVHGHRGARSLLPENTVPGFLHAIQAGADYIELDLQVTKDNVLVVAHDPAIPDSICSGPRSKPVIRELTLSELKQWECGVASHKDFPLQKPVPGARIPTVDEVFDLAGQGDFRFNIEVKSYPDRQHLTPLPDEYVRMVMEAVRRHKLESRVLVQSFDWRILDSMRRLAPEIPLSALYGTGMRSFVSIAEETGAKIVAPQFRLVTAKKVREAHARGIQVVPWTVNEPKLWDRMLNAGVDGIITDNPAALIEHLKKQKRR